MTDSPNGVQIVKLSDLLPDRSNANLHSERGTYMVGKSLEKLGAGRSILIDRDGEIIAGNLTAEQAADMGLEEVIVVQTDGSQLVAVQRTDMDLDDPDTGAREMAYADNRAAVVSIDFDPAQIAADVGAGIDVSDWWHVEELIDLGVFEPEPVEDPGPQTDRAEELREKWQVETGQLWQLGEHRLICGDCTDNNLRDSLGLVDVLITDPPYGINRDPAWLDGVYPHRQALSSRDVLQGDDGSLDLSFLWQYGRRMVWGFPYIYDSAAMGWVVWDKQPGVDGRGIVTPIEMASTTMRTGFDMIRVMWGGYYRAAGEDKQPHPTQKPLGVIRPFIEDWTKPGEIIADWFVGSGGVLIACEETGRRFIGAEIHPAYVAVTLQRWADATGREPELIG